MAATTETAQQKAKRLFLVLLDRPSEGALEEWLDANRAAGHDNEEATGCR